MTDKKPKRNDNNQNTARRLDFRTDEEIEADERAEQEWWDFIERCLESLKTSLQYNLPITLEGSLAALFIFSKANDNTLLQPHDSRAHTHTHDYEETFSTNNYHTPSNPRQRTILHKDPLTHNVIRIPVDTLDTEPEHDPEDYMPPESVMYDVTDDTGTRTFIGSSRTDATHEDSVEIIRGVNDFTPKRPQREDDEKEAHSLDDSPERNEIPTPTAPTRPERPVEDDDAEEMDTTLEMPPTPNVQHLGGGYAIIDGTVFAVGTPNKIEVGENEEEGAPVQLFVEDEEDDEKSSHTTEDDITDRQLLGDFDDDSGDDLF